MATMVAVYGNDGCEGRCDAKCYKAEHAHCDCVCGGMNHRVGLQKATQNTQELVDKFLQEYSKQHEFVEIEVPVHYANKGKMASKIARLINGAILKRDGIQDAVKDIRYAGHWWEVDYRDRDGLHAAHWPTYKKIREAWKQPAAPVHHVEVPLVPLKAEQMSLFEVV